MPLPHFGTNHITVLRPAEGGYCVTDCLYAEQVRHAKLRPSNA